MATETKELDNKRAQTRAEKTRDAIYILAAITALAALAAFGKIGELRQTIDGYHALALSYQGLIDAQSDYIETLKELLPTTAPTPDS